MARPAAITYDGLPISSGGAHKLRTRGLVAGLNALQAFASAVSLDSVPRRLLVEVLEGKGIPDDFTRRLCSEFDGRFTKFQSRGIGEFSGHQWSFEPEALMGIIEQLEALRPIPESAYAGYAAVVHVTWHLILADSNRQQIPYQSAQDYLGFDTSFGQCLGRSFVYSGISEKTTAHLFLSLPFEQVTDDARQLASKIEAHFPTRLSPNHWKIWKLTKKGDKYIGRKIPGLV
jgi:hypothetical protein